MARRVAIEAGECDPRAAQPEILPDEGVADLRQAKCGGDRQVAPDARVADDRVTGKRDDRRVGRGFDIGDLQCSAARRGDDAAACRDVAAVDARTAEDDVAPGIGIGEAEASGGIEGQIPDCRKIAGGEVRRGRGQRQVASGEEIAELDARTADTDVVARHDAADLGDTGHGDPHVARNADIRRTGQSARSRGDDQVAGGGEDLVAVGVAVEITERDLCAI